MERTGRATMREVWHEGERVDNESEPSRWGQGKFRGIAKWLRHPILVRIIVGSTPTALVYLRWRNR